MTEESLGNLSEEWQTFQDYWNPTKASATNWLNQTLQNTLYNLRPYSEDEKDIVSSQEYKDRSKSIEDEVWKEMRETPYKYLDPDREIRQRQRELLKEMQEEDGGREAHEVSYRALEDWMRSWQDGRMMNHITQRPTARPAGAGI